MVSTPRLHSDGGNESFTDRVLVLNPSSGSGDHAEDVSRRAVELGFTVRETNEEGDAADFAAEAVSDGASFVAAAGGDGTVNGVLQGIFRADGFDQVTFGIVPAGTGNNFATNIGVENVDQAFEVFEEGRRRTIDLAVVAPTDGADADVDEERVFVNSCVAGFTAEASAATSSDSKSQLGMAAYVVETFRTVAEFEPLHLVVETDEEDTWDGEAVSILIGNGRRFPAEGRTQADMEDGLLDVTIVEERPTMELAGEAAARRLFGSETDNIRRLKASALTLTSEDGTVMPFSLDGEMIHSDGLRVETRPGTVELVVGEAYEPHPEE